MNEKIITAREFQTDMGQPVTVEPDEYATGEAALKQAAMKAVIEGFVSNSSYYEPHEVQAQASLIKQNDEGAQFAVVLADTDGSKMHEDNVWVYWPTNKLVAGILRVRDFEYRLNNFKRTPVRTGGVAWYHDGKFHFQVESDTPGYERRWLVARGLETAHGGNGVLYVRGNWHEVWRDDELRQLALDSRPITRYQWAQATEGCI